MYVQCITYMYVRVHIIALRSKGNSAISFMQTVSHSISFIHYVSENGHELDGSAVWFLFF